MIGPYLRPAAWLAYPRPAVALSLPEAPLVLGGLLRRSARAGRAKRHAEQNEQVARSGFASAEHREIGHTVVARLLKRGHKHSTARYGAHLAAVGSDFNYQGNPRLAELASMSERTAQRARAELEEKGWIRSYLLEAGDRLPTQKRPVWRPQVVRDVSALQQLAARSIDRVQAPPQPSVADAPRAAEQEHLSVADWIALAAIAPDNLAEHFAERIEAARAREALAEAARQRAEAARVREAEAVAARQPARFVATDVEDWERSTTALEHARGPPPAPDGHS